MPQTAKALDSSTWPMLPGVLHFLSPHCGGLPSRNGLPWFTDTIQTGESAAVGSHFSGILLTLPGESLDQAVMVPFEPLTHWGLSDLVELAPGSCVIQKTGTHPEWT